MITQEIFSTEVELLYLSTGSYIESVVKACEEQDLEIEIVSKFLSPIIKQKIEQEARGLKLFKDNNHQRQALPF